jgi:hypothetical protein
MCQAAFDVWKNSGRKTDKNSAFQELTLQWGKIVDEVTAVYTQWALERTGP